MNRASDTFEDKVLRRLLAAFDASSEQAPGSHPSDEALALFAEGALSGAERDATLAHLAACPSCRHVAVLLMQDEREPIVLQPSRSWSTPQVMSWALAASLVVCVSAVLLLHYAGSSRPDAGHVARVEQRQQQPEHFLGPAPGPQVPKSETENHALQPPGPDRLPINTLAGSPIGTLLDTAGQLTDYGYGFDGRLTREFPDPFHVKVKELEALPQGNDLKALCDRGQRLLACGREGLRRGLRPGHQRVSSQRSGLVGSWACGLCRA